MAATVIYTICLFCLIVNAFLTKKNDSTAFFDTTVKAILFRSLLCNFLFSDLFVSSYFQICNFTKQYMSKRKILMKIWNVLHTATFLAEPHSERINTLPQECPALFWSFVRWRWHLLGNVGRFPFRFFSGTSFNFTCFKFWHMIRYERFPYGILGGHFHVNFCEIVSTTYTSSQILNSQKN